MTTLTATYTVQLRLINPTSKEIVGYERLTVGSRKYPFWQYSLDGEHWDTGVFEGDEWIRDRASGMKDIKGKDMYENDIVQFGKYQNVVVFQKARFGLRDVKSNWGARFYHDADIFPLYERLEVIGNIHRDAKLLEEYKAKVRATA